MLGMNWNNGYRTYRVKKIRKLELQLERLSEVDENTKGVTKAYHNTQIALISEQADRLCDVVEYLVERKLR